MDVASCIACPFGGTHSPSYPATDLYNASCCADTESSFKTMCVDVDPQRDIHLGPDQKFSGKYGECNGVLGLAASYVFCPLGGCFVLSIARMLPIGPGGLLSAVRF
jgi:hypothetical protein